MRKNKGFSLIEMLIIVAMIAALVAIGYPYFRGVMEKNKENADIAAMHSAEALMETAYNTRLIIGTKSATEATATGPLYYDPSGKLVWKRPAPYGQGTDGNQGVTWSCCGDYAYNPANDYRQGVIVCYYTPEGNNNPYPGIHVHWDCDGGSTITPDPVVKPTKPVFPERPTTEPTEGPTDPTVTPNPDPDPDPDPDPEPGENADPILDPTTAHPAPITIGNVTTGCHVHVGHRYSFKGELYISLADENTDQNYNPDYGNTFDKNFSSWFCKPSGTVYDNEIEPDQDGNRRLVHGDIFKETTTVGTGGTTVTYYIYKGPFDGSPAIGTVPSKDPANWVRIWDCPNNCTGAEPF